MKIVPKYRIYSQSEYVLTTLEIEELFISFLEKNPTPENAFAVHEIMTLIEDYFDKREETVSIIWGDELSEELLLHEN